MLLLLYMTIGIANLPSLRVEVADAAVDTLAATVRGRECHYLTVEFRKRLDRRLPIDRVTSTSLSLISCSSPTSIIMPAITTAPRVAARRTCVHRRATPRAHKRHAAARPPRTGRFFFTQNHMLRIALPNKGRLSDDARELFRDAGLDLRVLGDRALTASLGDMFEAIFVRAQDIPEFVADGAADAGVTGWDLVVESGRQLDCLADLGFGRCRLAVAATEASEIGSVDALPVGARVATTFPRVARRYFEDAGRDVEIVPVSGATEVAPHLGIADVIVDLVSTGSTLRMNGLREIATVLESSARIIARAQADVDRKLIDLVAALESVRRARAQRYLMANVRRDRLDEVRRVLPGLNGPTVVDILNSGAHVAVHAVVPASAIYRTVAELKALGAEGILVTRIERLMP